MPDHPHCSETTGNKTDQFLEMCTICILEKKANKLDNQNSKLITMTETKIGRT